MPPLADSKGALKNDPSISVNHSSLRFLEFGSLEVSVKIVCASLYFRWFSFLWLCCAVTSALKNCFIWPLGETRWRNSLSEIAAQVTTSAIDTTFRDQVARARFLSLLSSDTDADGLTRLQCIMRIRFEILAPTNQRNL